MADKEKAVYDPNTHAGIIHIEGHDFLITDIDKAGLDKFPLEYREVIASQTQAVIEMITGNEINAEGYRRGIALLRLPNTEKKVSNVVPLFKNINHEK